MTQAIPIILKLAGSLIDYLHTREKRKYIDRLERLKREYEVETNKPIEEKDDSKFSNIIHELELLSNSLQLDIDSARAKK